MAWIAQALTSFIWTKVDDLDQAVFDFNIFDQDVFGGGEVAWEEGSQKANTWTKEAEL